MVISITGPLGLVLLIMMLTLISTTALAQPLPSISDSSKGTSTLPSLNESKLLDNRLEKITSLSNILGASMVDGIQVSSINVGDTDLTATLKYQGTANASSAATATAKNISNLSLPVTVIAVKLPIANLTDLISDIEASRSSAGATGRTANPMDTTSGQIGSNDAAQSNILQVLSILKNIQIGAASIVNANWTMPQTVSMGFLGLGNRIAESTSSYFVLVIVVPFQGESSMPTLELG